MEKGILIIFIVILLIILIALIVGFFIIRRSVNTVQEEKIFCATVVCPSGELATLDNDTDPDSDPDE